MSWRKSLQCLTQHSNCNCIIRALARNHQNGVIDIEKNPSFSLQSERGYTSAAPYQAAYGNKHFAEAHTEGILVRSVKFPSSVGELLAPKQYAMTGSRQYSHSAQKDPDLNREFFVRLWVADRKRRKFRGKVKHKFPYGRWFSGAPVTDERSYDQVKPVLKQPPTSQSVTGLLKPCSPEEAQVAPLLARSNLLITRDIEWANLVLGFEQENRYAMIDVCYPQAPVGFIREQSNFIARQLLRLRRPFVAYITDGLGNILFQVRRPFWWITSSIYAEINGEEIGVVHRRWHLWKRIYDLYLGNKQFAVVENPGFWNWTFTLKDIDGNVLAEIDRNWRGFGFEILTDAGQYVIRFGEADSSSSSLSEIQELEVTRPLTLSERAVAVALAVSLDNDYFSRHGGWGLPFFVVGE